MRLCAILHWNHNMLILSRLHAEQSITNNKAERRADQLAIHWHMVSIVIMFYKVYESDDTRLHDIGIKNVFQIREPEPLPAQNTSQGYFIGIRPAVISTRSTPARKKLHFQIPQNKKRGIHHEQVAIGSQRSIKNRLSQIWPKRLNPRQAAQRKSWRRNLVNDRHGHLSRIRQKWYNSHVSRIPTRHETQLCTDCRIVISSCG